MEPSGHGLARARLSGSAGLGGFRVQETGVRNGAYGADKFGFKDLAAVRWNLTEPTLYEHAIARRRSRAGRRRRALRRNRPPHRPLAQGQAHRRRRSHREFGVVGRQPQDVEREFRRSARRLPGARQGQEAVRAGSLWRRRSEIPHQDARLHRIRLALAVHPPIADPPRARRTRRASCPNSPSSTCRRSSPTPSGTAGAKAPTPWWRSISPARSC